MISRVPVPSSFNEKISVTGVTSRLHVIASPGRDWSITLKENITVSELWSSRIEVVKRMPEIIGS